MEERIFIKPASPELIVRHPENLSHIIDKNGEWVMRSSHWDRYINDGDVIVTTPKSTTKEKSK